MSVCLGQSFWDYKTRAVVWFGGLHSRGVCWIKGGRQSETATTKETLRSSLIRLHGVLTSVWICHSAKHAHTHSDSHMGVSAVGGLHYAVLLAGCNGRWQMKRLWAVSHSQTSFASKDEMQLAENQKTECWNISALSVLRRTPLCRSEDFPWWVWRLLDVACMTLTP